MIILVAVDLSPASKKVVAAAADVADVTGASIYVLHAAEPEPDFVGYDAGPQTTRNAVADRFREQPRELQGIAEDIRDSGLDCEALLVQGPYVEKIISESGKLSADIIVIGAHSKGLLSRVLLGSVSEGVLKESRIPVLVVPAA